jgi:hypothetical protein
MPVPPRDPEVERDIRDVAGSRDPALAAVLKRILERQADLIRRTEALERSVHELSDAVRRGGARR